MPTAAIAQTEATYKYYDLEGHHLRWEHIGSITTAERAQAEFAGLCKAWPDRHFRIVGRTGAASKVLALYDARRAAALAGA